MKYECRAALLMILFYLLVAPAAEAQQAVILVRHAEKVDDSEDAALSPAGELRAAALASLFKDAGVTAVYATQYRRTIATVEPLARALNLPIETLPARDSEALVAQLRARHPDDVVFLAGHSNTLPALLQLLGHPEAVSIEDDEYDNIFIVVPAAGGPPVVMRLRHQP